MTGKVSAQSREGSESDRVLGHCTRQWRPLAGQGKGSHTRSKSSGHGQLSPVCSLWVCQAHFKHHVIAWLRP